MATLPGSPTTPTSTPATPQSAGPALPGSPKQFPVEEPLPNDGYMPDIPAPPPHASAQELADMRDEALSNHLRVINDAFRLQDADDTYRAVYLSKRLGYSTDAIKTKLRSFERAAKQVTPNFHDPGMRIRFARFLDTLRQGDDPQASLHTPQLSAVDGVSRTVQMATGAVSAVVTGAMDVLESIPAPWTSDTGEDGPIVPPKEQTAGEAWRRLGADVSGQVDAAWTPPEPRPYRVVKSRGEVLDANAEVLDQQRARSRAQVAVFLGRALGKSDRELAPEEEVLLRRPVLPARREDEEGDSVAAAAMAMQNVVSTWKGVAESQGATTALVAGGVATVGLAAGAVGAGRVGKATLGRTLGKYAARAFGGTVAAATIPTSWTQETGGMLEEVQDLPGFKGNPALALGASAVYGAFASGVESAATIAEVAAVLGVSPKTLLGNAGRHAITSRLRQAIIRDIKKNPLGALATLAKEIGEAGLASAKAEGAEEFTQGALQAMASKIGQMLGGENTLDLDALLAEQAGAALVPGAIAGAGLGGAGSAVRVLGASALAPRLGRLQALQTLVLAADAAAKKSPNAAAVRPASMSADLRRAAALHGPTAYIDAGRLVDTVEQVAAKQGVPAAEVADRAGVPYYVMSESALRGMVVPVALHDVMTKWTTQGLIDAGALQYLAAEIGGPTAKTQPAELEAQTAADADEQARQERLAAQTASARKLVKHFASLSPAQQQEALYQDEVSGALSSEALQDMSEHLGNAGYVLTLWSHQGQKVANDRLDHVAADVLYQTAARALSSEYEYVFKVGGDIVTAHKADLRGGIQQYRSVRSTAAAQMPGNAGLMGTVAEFVRDPRGRIDFKTTFDAAAKAHRERVRGQKRAKVWAARGTAPLLPGERAGLLAEMAGVVGLKDRASVVSARREAAAERFVGAVKAAAGAKTPMLRQALPPHLLAGWDASPEGLQRAAERLYVRKGSGLLTGRAYGLLEKIAPHKFTLPVDMRGLGDIDRISSDLADTVADLFDAYALAATPKGVDIRVSRLHGDEYAISSDDRAALDKFLADWRKLSQDWIKLALPLNNGTKVVVDGVEFFGEVHPVSTYAEADKLANKSKKVLDKQAREVVRWNTAEIAAAEKEGRDANLKEVPAGSRSAAESRLRLVPGDWRGGDVSGRGAGVEVGAAPPVARGPSGANLEGLADLLLAQEVDRTATAIRGRAAVIANEISRLLELDGAPDAEAQQALVRRLNDVVTDLIEEVTWRVATSASRSPAETNVDFAGWVDRLKANQTRISSAALRVEESARKAIKAALKEAKDLIESPTIKAFKENRVKADPTYRLHHLLFKRRILNEDGTSSKFFGKLSFDDTAARVANGLVPAEALDLLKEAGAFAPTGGLPLTTFVELAGMDTFPSMAEWEDVVRPLSDVKAARRVALRESAALATTKFLDEVVTHGLENVGEHLGSEWFIAEEKAGRDPKQQGPGGSPVAAIKETGKRLIAALRKGDISVKNLALAERRAATKAVLYAIQGKAEQALAFRQEQLAYQYATQYARAGLGQHTKLKTILRGLSKNETLKRIGRGSPEALAFVGGVLNFFGRGGGRFPGGTANLMAVLTEIANEDSTATVRFAPSVVFDLLDREGVSSLDDVTTEQAEHLSEALRLVAGYAARRAKEDAAVESFVAEQVAYDMKSEAEGRNVEYRATTVGGPVLARIRAGFQGLTRAGESVFAVLGRLGPHIHEAFFAPATEAVERHETLVKDVLGGFLDLVEKHGIDAAQVQPLDMDVVRSYLPERKDDTRNTTNLTRGWAISIALNAGNRGNLYWLLTQEGWSYAQVQDFLDATLTKEEWAFVEDAWKFMDERVYPLVEARYKARWGFAPKKVEASRLWVQSLGRHVSGGYFPIRFDPNAWMSWRSGTVDEMSEIHGTTHQASAMMHKSFTEARNEFATMEELVAFDPMKNEVRSHLPLDLRFSIMPYHLEEVVHYVAYEDMVLRLWRLAQNETFRNTVQRLGGEGALPQITDWVKDMARGRSDSWPQSIQPVMRLTSNVLTAATSGFVGASIPLSATDLVNTFLPTLLRLGAFGAADQSLTYGPRALLTTYRRATTGGFPAMHREAAAKSPAFRAMLSSNEVERIEAGVRRVERGQPVKEDMVEWGRRVQWYTFDYVTRMTATIGWHAKMLDAKSRGLSDAEALAEGEQFLSAFVVSHKPAFKAAMLRNSVAFADFARFMSFFFKINGEYVRRALHPLAVQIVGAHRAGAVGRVVVGSVQLVAANLAGLIVTGLAAEIIAGSGPTENEDTWKWIARKLLTNKTRATPVLGVLADPLISHLTDAQMSPRSAAAFAAVEATYKYVATAFNEQKSDNERVWAAIAATLLALRLPARQIERTGSYVTGQFGDDLVLGDGWSVTEGLIYGDARRGMTAVDFVQQAVDAAGEAF